MVWSVVVCLGMCYWVVSKGIWIMLMYLMLSWINVGIGRSCWSGSIMVYSSIGGSVMNDWFFDIGGKFVMVVIGNVIGDFWWMVVLIDFVIISVIIFNLIGLFVG